MGSISGSVDVDITGGGNPLPFALVTETVTAADDSGAAVVTAIGSADLGTVTDKFTLAVGLSDAEFSPSFASIITAAFAASSEQFGMPVIPFPVPLGTVDISLQGSLDNTSWYDLADVNASFVTSDGSTLAVGSYPGILTAVVTSGPLVRYVQGTVTLTLAGNVTVSVALYSEPSHSAYSGTVQVTSLQVALSVYAAADLNG